MPFQFAVAQPAVKWPTLNQVISQLGISTNLKLCLDAGDLASVASGSQTKWLDVAGSGYDFFRGTDGTSQTSDPTFNGTLGAQSANEYWGLDGGDFFRYDTTNETWMQNLHKTAAKWAFAGWFWIPSTASASALFGTDGGVAGTGIHVFVAGGTPLLSVAVYNAGGLVMNALSSDSVGIGAWVFLAGSLDAATPLEILHTNGTVRSQAIAWSSPAAGSASFTMEVSSIGNAAAAFIPPNGARVACLAIWEGTAVSSANLALLFTQTRAKFGV